MSEEYRIAREILTHYQSEADEQGRLAQGASRLEFVRTQSILSRYLPPPPARILDVGGGPGAYASWLAVQGYDVRLLDAVPLHVQQAEETARLQAEAPFSVELGDARSLPYEDESADAVLLLGPLYHLTEQADRLRVLEEAQRVLRLGGVLAAAAISRFASMLDGLWRGYLEDPSFVSIVERDLLEGQHRNPAHRPDYFTTAYFHTSEELADEVRSAGLQLDGVLGVEGMGWLVPDLDAWLEDEQRREQLLALLMATEREQSLLGASAHLLALARRPGS